MTNKKLESEKEMNSKHQERIKQLESDVEKHMKEAIEQKSQVVKVEETWKTKYSSLEGESLKWKIKAEEYEVSNKDLQKRVI